MTSDNRCKGCGGPHRFDTSVESCTWNRVIRSQGLPELLCLSCIVAEFAKSGEGFSATLWGEDLPGVAIFVCVL